MQAIKKSNHLPNLGVLRGFLALTVILLHIPLMSKNQGLPYFNDLPIFNKGYNAVWGFFTLSGFLIINLLYKEKSKTNTVNVKDFYLRRILRIYPVYYLVLFFGLFFYKFFLPMAGIPFEINYSFSEALFWCAALMPNVFFSLFDPGGILSVLWSIGIEEQFYLIIAPIARCVKSRNFAITLFVFTFSYFVLYFIPEFEFLRKYRLMYFYFSFGGLLAILVEKQNYSFLKLNGILKWLLYLCFVLYFITNIFESKHEILRHLLSMLLFGMFIINISAEKSLIIKNKALNYLGNISYGLYMYHMIALTLVLFIVKISELINTLGSTISIIIINVLTILITILLSHISFYYIENKFIALKAKYRNKKNNSSVIVANT